MVRLHPAHEDDVRREDSFVIERMVFSVLLKLFVSVLLSDAYVVIVLRTLFVGESSECFA